MAKRRPIHMARTESGRLVCMSATAMTVLRAVMQHPGCSYAELEVHTGVPMASLMVYAQRLDAAGLVDRLPHRDSSRFRMLVVREGVDVDLKVSRV